MRIYFSGNSSLESVPEALTANRRPHVMLTYYDIEKGDNTTLDRFNVYLERKYGKLYRPKPNMERPSAKVDCPLFTESLFMDSGAFSIFRLHAQKETKAVIGKTGRQLERVQKKKWGGGDYSYYSLAPGSEFRKYCDGYAKFMRQFSKTDILFTTLDAIQNPQVSWEVQQYFENEHGLAPVPVIHAITPNGVKWMNRYIEAGHTLIGFGGFVGIDQDLYLPWVNEMWRSICPISNRYKPIVRVHGFAMTNWPFMREWPWWSVDSASWIKIAAYGGILVPPWSRERKCFLHDVPPLQINMSRKPSESVAAQRMQKDRHYDNCKPYYREMTDRWLEHLGIPVGEFQGEEVTSGFGVHSELDPENFEVTEAGAASDFRFRAKANLEYYADFQASLPKWPSPLAEEIIVETQRMKYRQGLGL